MRALVTGAGGFVGQWLCRELLSDGWDVHGATLTGAPARGTLEDWQRDAVMWYDADLREPEDVVAALDEARPDAVFHLAGVAYVPDADSDARGAWSNNVLAAVTLLEALVQRRRAGVLDPVVVIAGSAAQYGTHPPESMPLTEVAEQRPASVYGATKLAQEVAALAVWRESGLRVVAARAFNHSGPGQSASFLVPALVERACQAKASNAPSIRIGNPTPVRDYLHVEDVARAYLYLALRGEPGEAYNVASGAGISVTQLAELILEHVQCEARLESDPALTRAGDISVLIGDATKLSRTTSWTTRHTLEMMIDDMIDAATN